MFIVNSPNTDRKLRVNTLGQSRRETQVKFLRSLDNSFWRDKDYAFDSDTAIEDLWQHTKGSGDYLVECEFTLSGNRSDRP